MATLKPCPASARTFSLGTFTSAKFIVAVSLTRWPSLSSFLPTLTPGVSRSTMKAMIPLWRRVGSMVAKTMYQLAQEPLVM